MSYSAIVGMLVPGSPQVVAGVQGDLVTYVYRGISSTLASNKPAYNDAWGASNEYVVREVTGPTRLEMSTHSEMIVVVATYNLTGATEVTNNEYPRYEIDFVAEEKSLLAHPAFSTLTPAERAQLRLWIDEQDSTARAALQYWNRDKDGNTTGTVQTLGTTNSPTKSQQDFAKMWLQGIEHYTAYNPVARKTQLYQGTDQPTVSGIGAKAGSDPFTGVPSGYEWIQSADSAIKQGPGFTWTRTREWIGGRKIAVDVDTVYI